MSTRSQKRRKGQHKSTENISETITSLILAENVDLSGQNVAIAEPSSAKSPRIENSVLGGHKASLKVEIPSEIRSLLAESQIERLKLLKPKTKESKSEQDENALEYFMLRRDL